MMKRPLISVVVDGYNESRELGTISETIEALRKQDFPLDQVEIVLVGSSRQIEGWRHLYAQSGPFLNIKAVAADDVHYLELKNRGAAEACGEIIALTDSDVSPKPTWLSAIAQGIRNGADVTVGPSLFKARRGWESDDASRQAAASITWGWILGREKKQKREFVPRGFMDHNVAFRAEVFRSHLYRTDLGRLCGAPLLFRRLSDARVKIALQPQQQVVHYFAWSHWLVKLHFRYGYEVFLMRRLDKNYPNQWIKRIKVLEPVTTMLWHVLLDVPRWFRFSRLLRLGLLRRALLFPLVTILSVAARTSEMMGMYWTLLAPKAMKTWAESV